VTIHDVAAVTPRQMIKATIRYPDGKVVAIELRVRIDTADELDYYRHGGILHYVVRNLAAA
jgi:aconitate hydratase